MASFVSYTVEEKKNSWTNLVVGYCIKYHQCHVSTLNIFLKKKNRTKKTKMRTKENGLKNKCGVFCFIWCHFGVVFCVTYWNPNHFYVQIFWSLSDFDALKIGDFCGRIQLFVNVNEVSVCLFVCRSKFFFTTTQNTDENKFLAMVKLLAKWKGCNKKEATEENLKEKKIFVNIILLHLQCSASRRAIFGCEPTIYVTLNERILWNWHRITFHMYIFMRSMRSIVWNKECATRKCCVYNAWTIFECKRKLYIIVFCLFVDLMAKPKYGSQKGAKLNYVKSTVLKM